MLRKLPRSYECADWKYQLCNVCNRWSALALNHVGGFTLGGLGSFLTFNKSFSMPINQVSQQLNAIVMALAGAELSLHFWMKKWKWMKVMLH